jgi:predicted DNA-binding WGR domain protein
MLMDKMGAQRAFHAGTPWRIRLVFRGANSANVSGRSDKFWEASQDGEHLKTGTVLIRWGKLGSTGSSMVKTWSYVETTLPEKLGKGYQYDLPKPTIPALSGPFARIASLRPAKHGFDAYDPDGVRLMTLTPDGARDLAQKHNVPIQGVMG